MMIRLLLKIMIHLKSRGTFIFTIESKHFDRLLKSLGGAAKARIGKATFSVNLIRIEAFVFEKLAFGIEAD